MLSYQHGYHEGCLADVHKHAALAALWSMHMDPETTEGQAFVWP